MFDLGAIQHRKTKVTALDGVQIRLTIDRSNGKLVLFVKADEMLDPKRSGSEDIKLKLQES